MQARALCVTVSECGHLAFEHLFAFSIGNTYIERQCTMIAVACRLLVRQTLILCELGISNNWNFQEVIFCRSSTTPSKSLRCGHQASSAQTSQMPIRRRHDRDGDANLKCVTLLI